MQTESTIRKTLRFATAVACIAMVSLLLCGIHRSVWEGLLLSAVMSGFTLFTLLLLAFRWANQNPSVGDEDAPTARPIQFRISTLLLLTLLVGVYLGVLRATVVKFVDESREPNLQQAFAMVTWAITLVIGMFLPWLIVADVLLAALAKLVKRPWGRRLMQAFFQSGR